MQIQVKCNCGADNCQEWAIVELQGVIEPNPSFHGSLVNLQIGVLCRLSSQENYTLTIGYHELSGFKVKLKKALLVLKKVKSLDVNLSNNHADMEFDVVGIIRQKILFKTRPKALISKPQLAVKEKDGVQCSTIPKSA